MRNLAEQTAPVAQKKRAGHGTLFIICAALLWSTGGILIKLIPWNSIAIAGLRSLFALMLSLCVIKDRRIRFTKTNIFGGLGMCASTYFYIIAVKMTTAANAIILQYTAPIFIIVLSALFLKKRPTRLDLCAVTVVFCGIGLFFLEAIGTGQLLGNFLGLLSGVGFAAVFLCNSIPGATPQQALLLGHTLGCVIGLPFAFFSVTAEPIPWLAVILLGTAQTGLAYFFLAKGSGSTPPLLASLISCIDPVLNSLWVTLFLGEHPGLLSTIGICIVIFGVIGYYTLLSLKAQRQSG